MCILLLYMHMYMYMYMYMYCTCTFYREPMPLYCTLYMYNHMCTSKIHDIRLTTVDLVIHTHYLQTTHSDQHHVSKIIMLVFFFHVLSLVMKWRFTDRVKKQMDAFLRVRNTGYSVLEKTHCISFSLSLFLSLSLSLSPLLSLSPSGIF